MVSMYPLLPVQQVGFNCDILPPLRVIQGKIGLMFSIL